MHPNSFLPSHCIFSVELLLQKKRGAESFQIQRYYPSQAFCSISGKWKQFSWFILNYDGVICLFSNRFFRDIIFLFLFFFSSLSKELKDELMIDRLNVHQIDAHSMWRRLRSSNLNIAFKIQAYFFFILHLAAVRTLPMFPAMHSLQ